MTSNNRAVCSDTVLEETMLTYYYLQVLNLILLAVVFIKAHMEKGRHVRFNFKFNVCDL